VVHVEFHDKSQKDYHFTDYYGFSMASLSEHGALFASDASATVVSGGSGTNAIIEFKPNESRTSNKSWNVALGLNENVKAVAITGKGPVVATDLKYLRFFSFSGLQMDVRCMPGAVVAMSGSNEFLFVAYHAGASAHGEQHIGYMLINVVTGKTVYKDALPLSSKSNLTWLGFSESKVKGRVCEL
jgi:hypothetical protein